MENHGVKRKNSYDEFDFVSLYDLLIDGIHPGVLARAIEVAGLSGSDRFGRDVKMAPDSEDARLALDGIARVHAYETMPDPDLEPWQLIQEGQFINHYGWLKDDLPDFDSIAEGVVIRARGSNLARKENNNLYLIGMLLEFIETGFGHGRHPHFSTLEHLALDIAEHARGRNGSGSGSVLKKLVAARKFIKNK